MFVFFKKTKKGNIEKEFNWLSLEAIVSELDEENLDLKDVVTGLCRLAIYGGLDLKKTIDSHKLLKKADPDQIVVEGIGYTWSQIFRGCLKSSNVDIYEDEELADAVYACSRVLYAVIDKYTEFEIKKNFSSKYTNLDLIKSTETLTGELLKLGDAEMLSDIIDSVGTAATTNIYASTMTPAIVKASINLLRIYLKTGEYLE